MSQTNECNVTYELVKPEELNPKERAESLVKLFFTTLQQACDADLHGRRLEQAKYFAMVHLHQIIRLPLIGTGRMQPESFEDLKYWKEVLNELEKI